MTIEEFDTLSPAEAESALRSCCGASRWVEAMVAGRPYDTVERLLTDADAAWRRTDPADWEEAFAHHPRIGETSAKATVSATAREWSSREQGQVAGAGAAVRNALAEGNREYERRFGRIYIVCAAGRGPEELLADLTARLGNPPDLERRVAAEAQRQITQQRLRRLFAAPGETSA
jgi:2-oxo-4-hydroxy-4-carboxy-5-ureidoimidazoline decarboxylase